MSVLLETSLGDIVIDLEVDLCPKTSENFLKLCKVYYYNLNAFFNVSKDFLAQTGDPSATGTGGESIWSLLSDSSNSNKSPRYFTPEIRPKLKHTSKGTVSMAVASTPDGKGGCGSQFFMTLADNIEYLDGKHAVFGHVVEGLETLDKLNQVYVDQDGRPLKDVRIRHVIILDDPFPDPPGLTIPPSSPNRIPDDPSVVPRIAEDEDALLELPEDEAEKQRREAAAKASALTLEMVGDLPFANVRPPENVLFVCKLNSVTRDEDLELIFSRFGKIMSCQVIRDKKTGDSLQYAFIEFDKREDAEQAYFKMQNVLVDDRRIWVDFSQSVARMNNSWSNNPRRPPGGGGMGGGRGRGGHSESFGGRDDLQAARRYRDEEHASGGGSYGMVFDVADQRDRGRNGSQREDDGRDKRRRDKEPTEDRERDRRNYREFDRERSPRSDRLRDRDGEQDRERERRRNGERDRERRDGMKDGYRRDDRDRERDRDRDYRR
ncbi:cyclophilin-like protein [Dacryopinax primogenitus]|uniref:Peptidyl-prolyl cis-trans isomerase n=1 Tax=Dacryopinax primogenitus (strain DJM 731) TaxID=1858805 RepID=M5GH62_DACPD|nr:cyclophilin-like protein [Dacryopinax primogenitus]EJU06683.1 cyclophilin-like protein [Dacryopinax primogenitus]